MNIIHKIIWVFVIVLFGCNNAKETRPVETSQPGIQLSEIRLSGLDGQQVNLNDYKGKTLFINFWATWCKPCLEEMPTIQNAMELLKDDNIGFLFVSEETTEQIDQFRTGHNYNFNYVRVENLPALNIMVLPTTFIFNPDGKLVFSEIGYRKWDDKSNIDMILKIIKSK